MTSVERVGREIAEARANSRPVPQPSPMPLCPKCDQPFEVVSERMSFTANQLMGRCLTCGVSPLDRSSLPLREESL